MVNVFATTQIIKQDKKYINNTTTIFSPNLIEQDKTVATLAKLYEEMIDNMSVNNRSSYKIDASEM